ncbi:THO complex subunit 1 transcription elongation factor-domain-containing protein [Spinellus fusiger]|nr:THO complex subunit 1 transcription elongation factor-domain-containing protein [Spinellus fusiger]
MSKFVDFYRHAQKAVSECITSAAHCRQSTHTNAIPPSVIESLIQTHIAPIGGSENSLNVVLVEGKPDWRKGALELVFRRSLLNIMNQWPEAEKERFYQLSDCLDIALASSELDYLDTVIPLTLIEELLDVHTIAGCEDFFNYVEKRKEQLIVSMVPGRGKGLVLLRMCNEMLRRLSQEKNTVFCGRILMFLANSLPLGERSGVNLRGDFNNEPVHHDSEEDLEADPTLTGEQKAFYRLFWSIRKYFSNPPSIFQNDNFAELQMGADAILKRFQTIASQEQAMSGDTDAIDASGGKRKRMAGCMEDDPDAAEDMLKEINQDYQFPRLLSSRKLLELEMEDARFRRNVIVQFLILFQYLSGFTQSEKDNTQQLLAARGATKQSLAQPPFTLEEEQNQWVVDMQESLLSLLRLTKPHGELYTDIVLTILRHERNWIIWKASGCPAFEKPPIDAATLRKIWESKKPRMMKPSPIYRFSYGNPEMTQLYGKTHRTLSEVMMSRRNLPKPILVLDQALEELETHSDDASAIERFNLANGALFQVTRLMSRTHAYLLPKVYLSKKEIYKSFWESSTPGGGGTPAVAVAVAATNTTNTTNITNTTTTTTNTTTGEGERMIEDKPVTERVIGEPVTERHVEAEIQVLKSTKEIIAKEWV